jgi:hypothetical protein
MSSRKAELSPSGRLSLGEGLEVLDLAEDSGGEDVTGQNTGKHVLSNRD